jgi:Uma2 family endonuclease
VTDPSSQMSFATVHPDPWTTDALYALPEDGMRHELLDGTLLMTPPPSVPHQLAARRLVAVLADAAPGDVDVLEAVGVALPAGLLVPDVVIARAVAVHTATRELAASDVLAVAEIVSPSSRTSDRRWKPEAYAEAGIGVFIRVELDTAAGQPEVLVHELAAGAYRVTAVARASEPTTVAVPFPITITASDLTSRGR